MMIYPFSDCAPSTSFHILLIDEEVYHRGAFIRTGFECQRGSDTDVSWGEKFFNCSPCTAGFYNGDESCVACPAGN